jgi:hypothetical protein
MTTEGRLEIRSLRLAGKGKDSLELEDDKGSRRRLAVNGKRIFSSRPHQQLIGKTRAEIAGALTATTPTTATYPAERGQNGYLLLRNGNGSRAGAAVTANGYLFLLRYSNGSGRAPQ